MAIAKIYVALHFRPAWQTCLTPFDQLYVLLFLPIKMRCDRVFRNHFYYGMGWSKDVVLPRVNIENQMILSFCGCFV